MGESKRRFRSRIAMYDETERLGGTRDGIILAVNSIGYEDVEHVWLPRYNGDWDRWAEFIIIINEDVANPQPTSTANLIREVRDKKESTSKDNYLIRYYADVWNKLISEDGHDRIAPQPLLTNRDTWTEVESWMDPEHSVEL